MAVSTPTDADSETSAENELVDRFRDAFAHVSRADTDRLHKSRVDGKSWVSNGKVLLATEEVSTYGTADLEAYSDTDYVETRSISNYRCYGFTSGEHIHWVDVELVRKLANDVFDVDYGIVRSWAKTMDTDFLEEHVDDEKLRENYPVMFDDPDSDYRIIISPVIGPDV